MSTRAIKWLEQNDITFSIDEYDHREKGAKFAAQAIGVPHIQAIKTLVVSIGDKNSLFLSLSMGDFALCVRDKVDVLRGRLTNPTSYALVFIYKRNVFFHRNCSGGTFIDACLTSRPQFFIYPWHRSLSPFLLDNSLQLAEGLFISIYFL